MKAILIFSAIVLAIAFGREWILFKKTGWARLSEKYPCRRPFTGKYKACWWIKFTVPGPRFHTVASVGHLNRWPISSGVPPYWIGAGPEGLYLKRNTWNFLHPPLLIPWSRIQSVNEITHEDLVRGRGIGPTLVRQPALRPLLAVAFGMSGQFAELKLSDPNQSLTAQLAAFEDVRRFLGGKLHLLNSSGAS